MADQQIVRKAVIPAAGLGTRLLPATKSQPKEMLPIVDTPVIQYVVEEAVAAGIQDILMIIGKGKRAIEEHFDRNVELEQALERKGEQALAEALRRCAGMANIHFVWQKEQRGLGDAVRYARDHVGNEPFALLLGDTLIESEGSLLKEMIRLFGRFNESIVALETVPHEKVSSYGIAAVRSIEDGVCLVTDLIEKPSPEEAPSNLAIAARYILTPKIFDYIEQTPPGKGGEIQLTDAMRRMLQDSAIYGYVFAGRRHDVGNKLDFLKTNVWYGLQRKDIGPELRQWLREVLEQGDSVFKAGADVSESASQEKTA